MPAVGLQKVGAFLLTFALAGMAHGQTKSADLPVPQRINCAPANALPPERFADATTAALWISLAKPVPAANSDVIEPVQNWTKVSWTEWSDSWSELRVDLDTLSGYFSDLVLLWRS